MDVLGILAQHGDDPALPRDVTHWIFFSTAADRERYQSIARDLGYSIHEYDREHTERPHALAITRNQSIRPAEIDSAVLELFRLAKQSNAEYDGWEAQAISVTSS
jgi:regulator of RNase E activity RraB